MLPPVDVRRKRPPTQAAEHHPFAVHDETFVPAAGPDALRGALVTGEPLDHAEVLEAGRAAATRMGDLLGAVVPRI